MNWTQNIWVIQEIFFRNYLWSARILLNPRFLSRQFYMKLRPEWRYLLFLPLPDTIIKRGMISVLNEGSDQCWISIQMFGPSKKFEFRFAFEEVANWPCTVSSIYGPVSLADRIVGRLTYCIDLLQRSMLIVMQVSVLAGLALEKDVWNESIEQSFSMSKFHTHPDSPTHWNGYLRLIKIGCK